jgi:predicted MPP superfamily phosphohydrolase
MASRRAPFLCSAGHTHGGQLMLSETLGCGPLLFRYWSGLYRKPERNGASQIVSNGVGNWFPLRTGAQAEILDLTLWSTTQS